MTNDEPQTLMSLTSTILELPPSCLEFCWAFPDFFVVGTYYLESHHGHDQSDSPSQERRGSLLLLRSQRRDLTLIQSLHTSSAILDLHFGPHDSTVLAAATSTGSLCFYQFNSSTTEPFLECISQSQLFDHNTLVLSLSWEPFPSRYEHSRIAVSLSNGNVAIVEYPQDFQSYQILWQSSGHSLEAWTVAYSIQSPEDSPYSLYSGGDDSALCIHNIDGNDLTLDCALLSRDTKTHGAGVTAILPLPIPGTRGQEILLTGSYDEYVRVYNTISKPRILAEEKLGGGVWRLKLFPFITLHNINAQEPTDNTEVNFRILASCMHAGVRVLRVARDRDGEWSIKVLAKFEEHESMNYASDVRPSLKAPDGEKNNAVTCVSTSFYDRKLCVWRYGGIGESRY
ncbi:MAG: hypothetical protein M1830_007390 [Pleopsidium flavum]|nr:MAG: hypothetical protein M1830_007390 [Pleopsidium flavum]